MWLPCLQKHKTIPISLADHKESKQGDLLVLKLISSNHGYILSLFLINLNRKSIYTNKCTFLPFNRFLKKTIFINMKKGLRKSLVLKTKNGIIQAKLLWRHI